MFVRCADSSRQRCNLDLIEPSDVVPLGPDSEPAIDKLAVIESGQHPLVIQR